MQGSRCAKSLHLRKTCLVSHPQVLPQVTSALAVRAPQEPRPLPSFPIRGYALWVGGTQTSTASGFYHRTAHHGALLECSVTSPEEARRAEEIWALEVGGGAGHFPCARNILFLLVQLESSQEALVSHEKMKPGSSFILGCVSETDWPGCSGCRDHRCRCARHGPPASGCGATSHAHPSLLCSLWPLVFLSSLL